ncbi:MAG: helix-turn-helix transcriptional regulator [Planctomycetota bacterium]
MTDPTPTIALLGIDTPQKHDFVHSHPHGYGRWSFLHFRTHAEVLDKNGHQITEVGGCILLDTGFPHWHRGHAGPLRTDWLVVDGDLDALTRSYRVPRNRLVHPRTVGQIGRLFSTMQAEGLRQLPFWQRRQEQQLEELLILIARGLAEDGQSQQPALLERLSELRLHVHSNLDQRWTLEDMAERIKLSRTHFTTCYRKAFGVSPVEDLLQARMQHACNLLARGMSVGECASQVGFQDAPWFSRCFRSRMGCSPRQFAANPGPRQR